VLVAAVASGAGVAAAAPETPTPAPAPLGITYAGWKGDYRAAAKRLDAFKAIGFQIVSFVPTYAYVGLDKIDLAAGPDAAELGAAVEGALRAGFSVVIKPHLDPPAYQSGFDPFKSDNHSWRVMCRGAASTIWIRWRRTTARASCSRRCRC